ncbi:MAG: FtsX-like permease family protein, partial [Tissierellia bacterium]|nr:FtsX-like permease family protein [Tissierellia bacterium]
AEEMNQGTLIIQAVLGGIGSISLIVAAIGIANTMVMSIYERTREIGIMKVIGASVRDIRLIFLTEASLIGLLGGVLGISLSIGISQLLNFIFSQTEAGVRLGDDAVISIIPPWLILLSLIFSSLIGLMAGYYPAKRATKLSAIEAIKTE